MRRNEQINNKIEILEIYHRIMRIDNFGVKPGFLKLKVNGQIGFSSGYTEEDRILIFLREEYGTYERNWFKMPKQFSDMLKKIKKQRLLNELMLDRLLYDPKDLYFGESFYTKSVIPGFGVYYTKYIKTTYGGIYEVLSGERESAYEILTKERVNKLIQMNEEAV